MIIKYFRTIFYSFYYAPAYIDAFRNWRGHGLKYLFLVTIVSSTFIVLGWMLDLSKINPARAADSITGFILSEPDLSFEDNLNRFINILQQIPEIKITDGALSTDTTQPYAIKDPASGNEVAIIDTTGKYKSLEGTDAVLLLTDTKLITNDEYGHEKVIYLKSLKKNYNIDEETLNEVLFIISQIPPFGLHAEKFVTEGDKLYKILDKKNRELVEVGGDAKLGENLEPMIAISTSEINYKSILDKNIKTIKVKDLNEDMLLEMIRSGIYTIRKIMMWGIPILALPFVIFTSFIFNALMLVFYSFIGHSFIKMMKLGQFEYKDIMRISAVAITPMLLASVAIPQFIPSQGTVYFLISIGYLYYAINTITRSKPN